MSSLRAAALVVIAVAAACSGRGGAAPPVRTPPQVTVARVEGQDLPITISAPVDLRPLTMAEVGSKTLGYLGAVLVDRGDRVRRGQPLALVRPSDLPDQLAAARGSLAQTQATAALARTNFERARVLAPSAVVSQQELQQAQAALAAAEANEAAARAQIAALGVRLGEPRIEAPLTGVVLSRRLDPGALVGPAAGPILTVARIDVLRVFVTVTEREVAGLTVGKDAWVEVDALPGRRFQGKVVRVAPGFDPTTRTLEAEVQLPNEAGELRPGMYGRATVVLETRKGVPVVSVGAVQISDNRHFVYVHQGGAVRRREIRVGFEGEEIFEVASGLHPGDEVVITGIDLVADGARVRAVPHPRPPRPAPPVTGVAGATPQRP